MEAKLATLLTAWSTGGLKGLRTAARNGSNRD